jgi:hypothetical protein
MTADEITRRAQLILQDLKLDPSRGILHEWMAHYVASAVTQLESGHAEPRLSDQCAATIAKLWEFRESQKQRELTSGVNLFMRQADRLDELSARRIQLEIQRMTTAGAEGSALDGESGITLWQIGKLEEHAIRVLWAATRHAHRSSSKDDETTETATKDYESDSNESKVFDALEKPILRSAQEELQKVFPDFEKLTLENYHLVSGVVHEALCVLDRLRHRILDLEPAATPSSMPLTSEMSAEETPPDDSLGFDEGEEPPDSET